MVLWPVLICFVFSYGVPGQFANLLRCQPYPSRLPFALILDIL